MSCTSLAGLALISLSLYQSFLALFRPPGRFMSAAKHLLRYLQGTRKIGLTITKPANSGPMNRPNILWNMWTLTGQDVLIVADQRQDGFLCSMAQQYR